MRITSCLFLIILFIGKTLEAKEADFFTGKVKSFHSKTVEGVDKVIYVFDIPIYGADHISNKKMIHAANIMAQYLDNDEDGIVDDMSVWQSLKKNHASLIMWSKMKDIRRFDSPFLEHSQDLGEDETSILWHDDRTERFDASLEEILHLITSQGYAFAYPDVFGEMPGSLLTEAMDMARGGCFKRVPSKYPLKAWFTYDDRTCGYECMATEYLYWGLTSWLGAQENRGEEIVHEWKLNTRHKMKETDQLLMRILTNPKFHIPQKLPNGRYTPRTSD
ncbi:hypothetical protein K5X82_01950 [Halosquirtibacter xylanolyticus]|uniref:hypothetical protein n=1 Tax=Halosquirtibacter xylanolyticus TaxID=3374599 RepID=UPI003748BC6A|nr:hypothetical protein K5X82_01950 [Prolixibacteraceae bacterium]